MADGEDDLLLWGDGFEVILDILEGDEAVEQQFVATTNNVSSNCANSRFEFLATDPKRSLVFTFVVWQVTRVTQVYKTQKCNLNMHVLAAMTDQYFCRS